ncbi:MAG: DUF3857 domain-containing protein, partial [Pseudomonadales bacterium]|nr:DUF3857 domain-containing protein [Pseudomonadales bacterium]
MYARSLVLLLLIFSGPAAHSGEDVVGKTPAPDWAVTLEVEPFASDRSSEHQRGVALLLADRQIRKTSAGFDFFERAVYRVAERSGLETASRITWSFDPSKTSLAFNHVRVRRDGRSEDRLADAEILVLRQETRLRGAMLDGLLTAVIDLEDIRVGDEIDFALSGSVATRLWPDEYFDVVSTERPYPIAQSHYRLDVPAELELTIESAATKLEPEIQVDQDRRIVVLHQFDP